MSLIILNQKIRRNTGAMLRYASRLTGLGVLLFLIIFFTTPSQAWAQSGVHAMEDTALVDELEDAWEEYWRPTFTHMTHQFATTMGHQLLYIGQFFDAKHQLESQLLFQEMTARAHKRYHPDAGICSLGTVTRSLFPSELKYRAQTAVLNQALSSRETLAANRVSGWGSFDDLRGRLEQFKNVYCDPSEDNGEIASLCSKKGGKKKKRPNKDINYRQTVTVRPTLDIDFDDPALTEDEEDVMALMSNLISHRVFSRIPEEHIKQAYAKDEIQDMRSVHAIRSVARNSLTHLIGMRAKGTDGAAPYMRVFLEDMGIKKKEIDVLLGDNPSYFAQMDVLIRYALQDPEFYTNLYTKPANVKRTGVALQAFKLMQDRDRFEASLRREMLVSMILELRLREHQDEVTQNLLPSIGVLFNQSPY